jgi:hypothetical protein
MLGMERLIWRAQQASRAEVVGWAAMNYIERREAGGQSNKKPFNTEQKGKTMEKYAEMWKSVMAYIWRSSQYEGIVAGDNNNKNKDNKDNEDDEDNNSSSSRSGSSSGRDGEDRCSTIEHGIIEGEESEDQDGKDNAKAAIRGSRPGWVFMEKQQEAFEQMSEEAHACIAHKQEPPHTDELEQSILELIIALLDHKVKDDEYTNAFYSGLAILGIDQEQGWRTALVYTPRLSAVVTVARMLVLYRAHCQRREDIGRRQERYKESKAMAEARATSHFDRVQAMVDRFMTIVSHGGQPRPMDAILRLRAYGKAIRANTNADGVVDWQGDTLLYGHVSLSMGALRGMVHGLLDETRRQLREEILMLPTRPGGRARGPEGIVIGEEELDVAGEGAVEEWPVIDWSRLVDNAAELKGGWNFTQDPRNKEALGGGVDGKTWLVRRIIGIRQLHNK